MRRQISFVMRQEALETLRIATVIRVMWRDIALANKESIITVMDQIMDDFKSVRRAIERSDGQYLVDLFTRARDARNHFGKLLEAKNLI